MNWPALGLLWLAGINLRITLLAVPPLLPLIHNDLSLSEKAVGALGGLPVLMFAAGSVFGSLLLARTGVIRAFRIGLAVAALAGALRGLGPDVGMLFVMTVIMGLGIAIMQPALPTLVGHWMPDHIGLATALYVNGLLVGEIIGVALTIPFALPLTGSWGGALAFWSIPLVANIVLLGLALRQGLVARPGLRGTQAPSNWWPDWRSGPMLRCGVMLGCAGSIYFTSNAFIPDYLHAAGRPYLVESALTALNASQIPASLLLLATADRIVGKGWPLIVVGLIGAGAAAGIVLATTDFATVFFSGVLGFVASFILILVLSLPPLLAKQSDVHRFSAGVFLIGYAISFASPVVSGALWDATHIAELAFAAVGGAGLVLALLASTLHFSRARQ